MQIFYVYLMKEQDGQNTRDYWEILKQFSKEYFMYIEYAIEKITDI